MLFVLLLQSFTWTNDILISVMVDLNCNCDININFQFCYVVKFGQK